MYNPMINIKYRNKFFVFIAFLAFLFGLGCNNPSRKISNKEIIQESLITDSLRIIKCDSLFRLINSNNSGNVNLPNIKSKTIEECITQLDTCTNDTIKTWMKCVTEDEYVYTLHHGFGTYIRNNWGLWAGSELAKFFIEYGISQPDDMSSIILSCFHQKVNYDKYDFKKKVEESLKYWEEIKAKEEKKSKINAKRRAKSKHFIDSIHEAINYDSILQQIDGLVYDSLNLFIEQDRNDTLSYWNSGNMRRLSKEQYAREIKDRQFGRKKFFAGISHDGSIFYQRFRRERFIRRNDTLFFEDEKNKFVNIFTPDMMKNMNYVLEWKPVSKCAMFKSFIKIHWILKSKKYFLLELQGDCKGTPLKVRYFIDEDLNVIFDENLRRELWRSKNLIDR